MQINITLLIQAMHFLIAYYFLHNFLFVPVMAIIEKEDADKMKLHAGIDNQKELQGMLQKKKKLRWAVLKNKLFKQLPSSDVVVVPDQHKKKQDVMTKVSVPVETVEKTEEFLVDKLSNVSK